MRRVVDRVRQERVDRRARLELPVVAVEDLDAGARRSLSTAANGYFTERSFEANSSFDSPAM